MMQKLKHHPGLVILFFITLVLCVANYTPGTFLSGWDTLHPEFDLGLNFKRVVLGVFRSEQGLGAVAAHSHMVELPRIVLFSIFKLFLLPIDTYRYLYMFLMLIVGPIGMYIFLYKHVVKNKFSAFLGALFYVLNLGTLQQFFVPFEMFTTEYGLLPWTFLFATDYMKGKKISEWKPLLLFCGSLFLASAIAYAATLWYLFFLSLASYLFVLSILLRTNSGSLLLLIKKFMLLLLLTIVVNAYWLFPNIYFVLNHADAIPQANINKLFSKQAFLYNKEFGNIQDISLLKTFYFDWSIYSGNNTFDYLLLDWKLHLDQPFILFIGYLIAAVASLGFFSSLSKRAPYAVALLPTLFFTLLFLFNDNPPTAPLYSFIQDSVPLFREAMRFPGDKVLGLWIFLMAFSVSLGQQMILDVFIKKLSLSKFPLRYIYAVVFSIALLLYMWPALQGMLISPRMRVAIPHGYFALFDWLNKQEAFGRVANLPIHSLWGWEYYNWYEDKPSFQGAGFIWFGIKQPVLARDFDRWSPLNEGYYREMSYAVYSKNPNRFARVLQKYNIRYVLLDTSVIAPDSTPSVLYYEELKQLLQEPYIVEKHQFAPFLTVYSVDPRILTDYISSPKTATMITPIAQAFFEDIAFETFGDYITRETDKKDAFYPFRSIIDNQNKILPKYFSLTQEEAVIKLSDTTGIERYKLPSFGKTEKELPADMILEKVQNQLLLRIYPKAPLHSNDTPILAQIPIMKETKNIVININQQVFVVDNLTDNVPHAFGTVLVRTTNDNTIAVYENSIATDPITPDFRNIDYGIQPCTKRNKQQIYGINPQKDGRGFSLFGTQTNVCMMIPLVNILPQPLGDTPETLMTLSYTFHGGTPSQICLATIETGTCTTLSVKSIEPKQQITQTYEQAFAFPTQDIAKLGLKISFDTTNAHSLTYALYDNVSLKLDTPFFYSSFPAEYVIASLGNPTDTSIATLTLPFSGKKELSTDITTLPKSGDTCTTSPRTVTTKIAKKILKEKNDQFIRYTTNDGSLCDHFSYQNLSHDQGYFLVITARTIRGLPLTICVTNYTSRRCDLYSQLTPSDTFTQTIFLLPPMNDGNGYDVNVNNLGIQDTPSINDLASIEFIPLPYNWISRITRLDRPKTLTKNITLHSIKTLSPLSFAVGITLKDKQGLLVLSEGYEQGWVLYQLSSHTSSLQRFLTYALPFLFGKQTGEHVVVNNWANGWILDNSESRMQNSELVIVYLPQYLQYLGFTVTIITVITLSGLLVKERLLKRHKTLTNNQMKKSWVRAQN